jgi:hypothetical protein
MRKQRFYSANVHRELHALSSPNAFVIAFNVPFQSAELNGITATQQLMDVDGHAYRFDGATVVELPNKPVRASLGTLVAWQSAFAVSLPHQLPPGPIVKGPVDAAVAHALTVFLTPMSTYLEVGGALEPKTSEASITEPIAPGATDQALLVHKGSFATGSGEDVTLTSQAWLHHGDGRLTRLVAEGDIEPREGRSKTEGGFHVDMKCAYKPLEPPKTP